MKETRHQVWVKLPLELYEILNLYCVVNNLTKQYTTTQPVQKFLKAQDTRFLKARLRMQLQEKWETQKAMKEGCKGFKELDSSFKKFRSHWRTKLTERKINKLIISSTLNALEI